MYAVQAIHQINASNNSKYHCLVLMWRWQKTQMDTAAAKSKCIPSFVEMYRCSSVLRSLVQLLNLCPLCPSLCSSKNKQITAAWSNSSLLSLVLFLAYFALCLPSICNPWNILLEVKFQQWTFPCCCNIIKQQSHPIYTLAQHLLLNTKWHPLCYGSNWLVKIHTNTQVITSNM